VVGDIIPNVGRKGVW